MFFLSPSKNHSMGLRFRDLFLQWGGSQVQHTESLSLITFPEHEGSRYTTYLAKEEPKSVSSQIN